MVTKKNVVGQNSSSASNAAYRDLLDERFSCRGYRSEPVSPDVITDILTMAQRTASWCNSQPWQAIITRDEGTERFRKALFEHASTNSAPTPDLSFPDRYAGIYKERQRECGWQLYSSVGIEHGDREASGRQALENFRLFGAPHVALITSERDLGTYGVLDCGGYVSNFMLAARAHGVASIAQAALAIYGKFIRDYFEIPEHRVFVCGISFGYADPHHPANGFRTSRAPVSDVGTIVDR